MTTRDVRWEAPDFGGLNTKIPIMLKIVDPQP